MSKATKIWLIIAASLVFLGIAIFATVMTAYNWDFTKLSTEKYETNTYEVNQEFVSISIKTDTADIVFAPSNDGISKIICYEQEKSKHSVEVENGTLMIDVTNGKKWYDYIGISAGTPKITVYLPKKEYGELTIKESTGDIEIPKELNFECIDISASTGDIKASASASKFIEITTSTGDIKVSASASKLIEITTSTGDISIDGASTEAMALTVSTGKVTASDVACDGDVTIKVSTGKTYLTNISCKNIISSGNTGDITLRSVIAAEKVSVKRSTGDVSFDRCDAAEIFVETDTGDVSGTLLSEKVFIPYSNTGSIKVPETTSGGKCKITTDTGNIHITLA